MTMVNAMTTKDSSGFAVAAESDGASPTKHSTFPHFVAVFQRALPAECWHNRDKRNEGI